MFDTALPLSILHLWPNLANENLFKSQFLHLSAGFTLIWLVRRKLVNLCARFQCARIGRDRMHRLKCHKFRWAEKEKKSACGAFTLTTAP